MTLNFFNVTVDLSECDTHEERQKKIQATLNEFFKAEGMELKALTVKKLKGPGKPEIKDEV